MNANQPMPSYYGYVSSRAGYDPVPTVYLCAPSAELESIESAERYAETSGWKDACEEAGAVLVMPIVDRWTDQPADLLRQLYRATMNSFMTRSGRAIWGREGKLWCWEVVVYLVGIGDGADYAARSLRESPDFFAAAALINPSENVDEMPKTAVMVPSSLSAQTIYRDVFEPVVRWKTGLGGTIAKIEPKDAVGANPRYLKRTIQFGGTSYDYFVLLPDGMSTAEAAGLPLVFTIHGRGEPAWMFVQKNGWIELMDETRAFVFASPDSPGNIWFYERDGKALVSIRDAIVDEFALDSERVYLTGFSNGGILTREIAMGFPEKFAAISPWNAPRFDTFEMARLDRNIQPEAFHPDFERLMAAFAASGYQMPCFYIYGDSDPAASPDENWTLDAFLAANRCDPERGVAQVSGVEAYPPQLGFRAGERFKTVLYYGKDGVARVAVTLMKEMPHGAIFDEARAAWRFLKAFRRPNGGKEVVHDAAAS